MKVSGVRKSCTRLIIITFIKNPYDNPANCYWDWLVSVSAGFICVEFRTQDLYRRIMSGCGSKCEVYVDVNW
jgi:hypothetical protein